MFFYLKKETFIFLKATELCQKLGLLCSRSAAGSCLGGPEDGLAVCQGPTHRRATEPVWPSLPLVLQPLKSFLHTVPRQKGLGY